MSLYATAGMKLYIGAALAQKSADFVAADFSSQTWTEITGLESLGTLGDTSQAVTFTSINDSREKTLKGSRSAGTMEVVCAADNLDAGQIAVIAAEKLPHDYAFKLEGNDKPPVKSSTATITIASPGVVTWTAHGRAAGEAIVFSTTGALPTGIVAGTTYYILSSGMTSDSFQISATPGGSVVNTTGTQSGVHTVTTQPTNSLRYFIAKVMTSAEVFDSANNVQKRNMTLGVNSNIVRVAASLA